MTALQGRFSMFDCKMIRFTRDHLTPSDSCVLFCQCRKCQKVLGKNMELWENEVYRFKTIGQLKVGEGLSVILQ